MKRKLLLFFALLIAVGMKAAEDLQPTNVTPEIGATYLISENDGSIVFTFDRQLKIDKAYIIPANIQQMHYPYRSLLPEYHFEFQIQPDY